jgi:excisionase family DNA binding protein
LVLAEERIEMIATAQRLMSVKEVADYLGVHPQTVYALIRNGQLRAMQLNGRNTSIRISEDVLEAWLAERFIGTEGAA